MFPSKGLSVSNDAIVTIKKSSLSSHNFSEINFVPVNCSTTKCSSEKVRSARFLLKVKRLLPTEMRLLLYGFFEIRTLNPCIEPFLK